MRTGIYSKAFDLLIIWAILIGSNNEFRAFLSESTTVPVVELDTVTIVAYKPQEVANNEVITGTLEVGENAHEKMIDALSEMGVKYSRIVWHQIILETGWLKSRVYKENNNPFGMKRNLREYALNPRGKSKPKRCDCYDWELHACYPSKYEAILDFIEWQSLILNNYKEVYGRLPKNDMEYLAMLNNLPIKGKSGKMGFYPYASAGHYTKAVKRLMSYTEAHPLIAGELNPRHNQLGVISLLGMISI
jgi:hypothetical protein